MKVSSGQAKVKRKIQEVPQWQAALNPWHQAEEKLKTESNTSKINKQMHEKHIEQLFLPQARWWQS